MHIFPIVLENSLRIQGFPLRGIWMDVGRPHDLIRANMAVANRYGSGGGEIEKAVVDGTVYVGSGSKVQSGEMTDSIVLRDSLVVDSYLKNTLIMESCTIVGADIQDSIIGEGCTINAGAVIRNAVLEDGTSIASNTVLDEGREV